MNKREYTIESWTNMHNKQTGYVIGYYDDHGWYKVPDNGIHKTKALAKARIRELYKEDARRDSEGRD